MAGGWSTAVTCRSEGHPRVLIADDEVLLRAGLARLLERAGMEVVAEAGDADEVLRAVVEQRPDVAICDLRIRRMAHADGLRLAIAIRYEHPDTAVAVLTPSWRSHPLELIGDDAEGVGYLPKQRVADAASFVESVRRVVAGGSASVAA